MMLTNRRLAGAALVGVLLVNMAAAQIRLRGELDPSVTTSYGDVWGFDGYAVLGSRLSEGVFIIDLADPTAPSVAAQYFPSRGSAPQDVKVQDSIGYFAMNGGGGVDLVDLSDPSQPMLISNVNTSSVHNVSVLDSFLFTTTGNSQIKAYDVSDPAAPQFLYNIPTTGSTHDMTALGDRLYASNFSGTTQIFDISQMSATTMPELLGTFDTGGSTHSNWVTDDANILVTAAERRRGDVRIYDISDPANPLLLSLLKSGDFITGMPRNQTPHNPLIVGDILYVSWYTIGLQMFDISDPGNPIHIGRFDTQNNWGVYPFLGPELILLSDIDQGLKIVDVRSVLDGTVGDFNGDGQWSCTDVDQLVAEVASGSTNRDFDMNGDGFLRADDVSRWLDVAGSHNLPFGSVYLPGDATLDGVVDSADFAIWDQHKFTAVPAFCSGDFSADGFVDGTDFLIWEQARFQSSTRLGPVNVPEPATTPVIVVLLVVLRASRMNTIAEPGNLIYPAASGLLI